MSNRYTVISGKVFDKVTERFVPVKVLVSAMNCWQDIHNADTSDPSTRIFLNRYGFGTILDTAEKVAQWDTVLDSKERV